ncbi:hypothetical protein B6264_22465 [Kitasatospora aureofaciens]|nr:hypothetical protein B6264_22465 [Kitasatospora aureofaciens]
MAGSDRGLRTLSRLLSGVMQELGASGRFEAGVRAAKPGRLDRTATAVPPAASMLVDRARSITASEGTTGGSIDGGQPDRVHGQARRTGRRDDGTRQRRDRPHECQPGLHRAKTLPVRRLRRVRGGPGVVGVRHQLGAGTARHPASGG